MKKMFIITVEWSSPQWSKHTHREVVIITVVGPGFHFRGGEISKDDALSLQVSSKIETGSFIKKNNHHLSGRRHRGVLTIAEYGFSLQWSGHQYRVVIIMELYSSLQRSHHHRGLVIVTESSGQQHRGTASSKWSIHHDREHRGVVIITESQRSKSQRSSQLTSEFMSGAA